MSLGNGFHAHRIPIIGADRTWKEIAILPIQQVDPHAPMQGGRTVGQSFPNGLFTAICKGIRSDGYEVVIGGKIRGEDLANPLGAHNFYAGFLSAIQTYRDCSCSKEGTCVKHAPKPKLAITDDLGKAV